MGLSADQASDLTQQAYLVAVERLPDIRAGSERAFLVGTALRLAHSARRRARRMRLDDDMDVHPGRELHPERLGEDRAAIRLLDRVLAGLPPPLVTVFVLFELEGLSSPEIAQTLDIPVGTVASRLRRARLAFRTRAARLERSLSQEVHRR